MRPIVDHIESFSSSIVNPLMIALNEQQRINSGSWLDLGEVSPITMIKPDELLHLCSPVLQAIEQKRYKPAGNKGMPPDILMAKGNIGVHCDYVMGDTGIIALVLLRVQPLHEHPSLSLANSLYEQSNMLWTNKTLTNMEVGTMVIFDTYQEHAWFCSGIATFLSIPLVKQRAKAVV